MPSKNILQTDSSGKYIVEQITAQDLLCHLQLDNHTRNNEVMNILNQSHESCCCSDDEGNKLVQKAS